MAKKEYLGGVAATTLASNITNVDTAVSVADGSTFPTAVTLPFPIVFARGTSSEEKALCTSRSGNSLTVTRGYDGTTAVAHTAGIAVEHCIDALVVTAASDLISEATTAGDLVYWTGSENPQRLAIGTARQVLATNAGATAPEWVASLQSLLTAQGDIIYASAANTPARLAKGTAAQVLTMNAGATAPAWAAASSGSLPSARAERTAGNITLNSTTLVDVDTGTDLTLTGVVAGDVVEVSASGFWGSEATAGILDCKSVTGGNFWSGGRSFGVMAWHGTASEGGAFGGTVQRAVVAGDLSAGTLVIRFQHKTTTAVNKSFVGDTTTVFQVSAKNLRQ